MAEAQLSRDQVKDYLKNMSLIEAAALVKELEAELGVSAAAPVAVAAAGPAAGGAAAAAAVEKDEFTVMLTGSGDKKIQVTARPSRSRKASTRPKRRRSRRSWKKRAARWS